jgi:hypothetical protein
LTGRKLKGSISEGIPAVGPWVYVSGHASFSHREEPFNWQAQSRARTPAMFLVFLKRWEPRPISGLMHLIAEGGAIRFPATPQLMLPKARNPSMSGESSHGSGESSADKSAFRANICANYSASRGLTPAFFPEGKGPESFLVWSWTGIKFFPPPWLFEDEAWKEV